MRHKNRTVNGDKLVAKHQATYEKWWLNKKATEIAYQKLDTPEEIMLVEYIGNSVYGIVKITTETLRDFYLGGNYRPGKDQVKLL